MFRSIVIFIIITVVLPLRAERKPHTLSDRNGRYPVEGNVQYCRAPEAVSFDAIRGADFQFIGERAPALGFKTGDHWFKLDIDNQSTTERWFIQVSYAPLDVIDFHYRDTTGSWRMIKSGDVYPLSTRPLHSKDFIFPFDIRKGQRGTVYFRITSTSAIQFPATIWRPADFFDHEQDRQFSNGIFYGILLIMIFYNLFLYFSVRDVNMLYYILTLLAGINVIAFFQGYGFYLLYPETPQWNEVFTYWSGPLFIFASAMLARSFLNLKAFSTYLDRALLAAVFVTLMTATLLSFKTEIITLRALHVLTVINLTLILVSAVYCLVKKYRPARYFLLAWVSILLAGVAFSLRNLGIIEHRWISDSSLYFGGIMQTLLISLALGDRINILTTENQRARELELKRQQDAKDVLEKEVQVRTQEISDKKIQLEEINSVKDKLFSLLSHDLKGPINSLKGALTVLQMNALTPEEFKKVSTTISGQLQDTSVLLDHLLQWSKTQMQGMNFSPKAISLSALIGETAALLHHDFELKKIRLAVSLDQDLTVKADEAMIKTVLRNLLTNALKFTGSGGSVTVETNTYDSKAIVVITDTGVGIAPVHRDALFTIAGVTRLGTREEKGTGIGLVLCREFIEQHGGTIWFESEEGKGTKFSFSLPMVEDYSLASK